MKSSTVGAALLLVLATTVGCERKTTPPPAPEPTTAEPEGRGRATVDAGAAAAQVTKVEFPEVPIRAGATTTVKVAWRSPEGTGVNEEAPFRVRWHKSDALAEAPSDVKQTGASARDGFHIAVKPLDGAPNATLGGVIELVVCDVATHSVCTPVRRKVEIEFVVAKSAPEETTVTVDLPQARAM